MNKMSEMNYEDLVFIGREFKKKGTAAFGEWKLFTAKFDNAEGKTLKFSAFGKPKKGLSIEDLKEGEDYNVGFTEEEKTFEGDNGTVTYTARTIKFIDDLKEKSDKDTQSDLLTEKDDSEPSTGSGLNDYVPSSQELVWLNKLKALDPTNVTEVAFKETMQDTGRTHDTSDKHMDELWAWFNGGM